VSEQITLLINTATISGVIGIGRNSSVASEVHLELSTSSNTVVQAIDESFAEAQCSVHDLSTVLLVKGPGTFTGSRVGVSIAKAIAYACSCPLLSVTTLQAVAMTAVLQNKSVSSGHVWALLDARRHEFYVQEFVEKGGTVDSVEEAKCLGQELFYDMYNQAGLVACAFPAGSVPSICRPHGGSDSSWLFGCYPDCSGILALKPCARTEDPFVLEPLYLRSTEELFDKPKET